MSWGNQDNANNAPKWKNIIPNSKGPNRGNTVFANTTESAFVNNVTIGLYGVDLAHVTKSIGQPGWILETQGSGPVIGYTVSAGGLAYANTNTVTVSNGMVNATGTLVTNSTGGVVSVTPVTSGAGFTNNSILTVTITTATGNNAVITPILGGRANRKQYEVLVAMGSISGNTYEPT